MVTSFYGLKARIYESFQQQWFAPNRIREIALYLNARFGMSDPPETRFILYGSPRSGTTLTGHLLSYSPAIDWGGEKLRSYHRWPFLFLDGLSRRSLKPCYGLKLFVSQLISGPRLLGPAFLDALYRGGWKIISLKRNGLAERVISFLRFERVQEEHRLGRPADVRDAIVIPVARFLERIRREAVVDKMQDVLLGDLPHLALAYEEDLLDDQMHQKTADRIFDFLGVPSVRVETRGLRVSSGDLSKEILNYDELVRALEGTEYAGLLQTEGV